MLTRAVGVACLAFLGAAAYATILATLHQFGAVGINVRLLCTLIVNVCVFVLMVIESVLILSRPRALAKAPGVKARAWALTGTWIMFVVVLLPVRTDLPNSLYVLAATFAIVGDLLTGYVVLHLGGSFSVMAEARRLVEAGPYAVVRHPLYLAELVAMLGVVITYFSWQVAALFAVQSGLQYMRAREEERVLAGAFPEYAAYRRRTPMVIPRP